MEQERRIGAFVGLAFAISWALWGLSAVLPSVSVPLKIAGTFGPAIAAMILVWPYPHNRRALLARLVQWRMPVWVWLYALTLPFAGIVLSLALVLAAGGAGPVWPDPMPVWVPFAVFAYVLAFSVAGEELGWRGYALPALIERYGPIIASLGIGLVWGVWHAPLFLLPGDFHGAIPTGLFILQIVASSLIYTHLHFASSGSLVPAHLFHTSFNVSVGLLPVLPEARGGNATALGIAVGLLCFIAVVTAVGMRRRN